jgi:NAD dependent epimerase/dehydratase
VAGARVVSWTGRRVLVTGAGGFIGSHLAEALVVRGARVRAFVHYRGDGRWGWLDESAQRGDMNVVTGDIGDRETVASATSGCDVVFHLAALIGIPYSYQAARSYVRVNVEGTLNVLQCAREAGVARVVHTSTSEVYGTARRVPIDEDHPLHGQSPYSASKIAADKMAEAFHLSFGLPVVTVRPFNAYGPRQSARAVIPTVVSQCLAGGPVRLGNLRATRDFTYVTDTVEGFVRAAEVADAVGRTLNLGSGTEIAVGELAARIVRLIGRNVEVMSVDERTRPAASEVERLLADSGAASAMLGWRPTVSLDAGLRRTIAWIEKHLDDYRPDRYAV